MEANELEEYLAPDEPVRRTVRGTLFDASRRSDGLVGVSDRRVLFVSDAEGFLDASFDAIHSIECRPRTSFTYRGIGYRLVAILGVLVAFAGIGGVVVLDPTPITSVLAVVSVGGAVAAESVRRAGVGVDRNAADVVGEIGTSAPGSSDVLRRLRWSDRSDDADVLLILGIGLVSLLAVVGLIVRTGGLVVLPLALVALVGLALTDRALRRTRTLDETGAGRRTEHRLDIHLDGGRTVRLRVDGDPSIVRELSEATRGIQVP